jgi:hypothetical protein
MTRRSLSLAVALGALGGVTLVLSRMFFTPGKYLLIPYALVVLGSLLAIRAERLKSFSERFVTGLLSFVLSSVALYVSISFSPTVPHLGFLGHAWRLAFIVGLGALISLATARVASPPEHREGLPA